MASAEGSQRPEKITRQQSVYTDREAQIVQRCLEAVEAQAHKREGEGLNVVSFAFGVMNVILIAYIWGAFPEHFWILYIGEMLVMLPLRWHRMAKAKPMNECLYWLDFCWVSTFVATAVLFIFAFRGVARAMSADGWTVGFMPIEQSMSPEWRKRIFWIFWGVGNGPLLGSVGALGNGVIFHSVDNMLSLFIHLLPSLVLFTLRWQTDAVRQAWPHVFKLDYMGEVDESRDILHGCAVYYALWLAPFTLWMLTTGLNAPTRMCDTVFHANMRGGPVSTVVQTTCQKRKRDEQKKRAEQNQYTRLDVVIYMLLHCLCFACAIVFAMLTFRHRWAHMGSIVLMVMSAVWQGAARYNYYVTKSYGSVIRKELKAHSE